MDTNGALILLSESNQTDCDKKPFEQQSFPQKVFSAIWALEREVNNGGFWQYFVNSSAESAYFVIEALTTIDALAAADICRRAIDIAFPNGLPPTEENIRASAEERQDELRQKLDLLEQEFYQYPDNLTDLLYVFVAKHPDEFGEWPVSKA
jgi:hypothetical protein